MNGKGFVSLLKRDRGCERRCLVDSPEGTVKGVWSPPEGVSVNEGSLVRLFLQNDNRYSRTK